MCFRRILEGGLFFSVCTHLFYSLLAFLLQGNHRYGLLSLNLPPPLTFYIYIYIYKREISTHLFNNLGKLQEPILKYSSSFNYVLKLLILTIKPSTFTNVKTKSNWTFKLTLLYKL